MAHDPPSPAGDPPGGLTLYLAYVVVGTRLRWMACHEDGTRLSGKSSETKDQFIKRWQGRTDLPRFSTLVRCKGRLRLSEWVATRVGIIEAAQARNRVEDEEPTVELVQPTLNFPSPQEGN